MKSNYATNGVLLITGEILAYLYRSGLREHFMGRIMPVIEETTGVLAGHCTGGLSTSK